MMKKEENPELFKAICGELSYNDLDTDFDNLDFLTDEQLERVYFLKLNINNNYDVRDLHGIEKLPNLISFSITGATTEDWGFKKIFNKEYSPEQEKELDTYYHHKNQVADFSPLKNCKNLESIYITHQQKFTNLDLTGMNNLQTIDLFNCNNLISIRNASESMSNKSLERLAVIYCGNFKDITDIDAIIDNIKNKYPLELELPVNTYMPITYRHPAFHRNLRDLSPEQLTWSEVGGKYNTQEMLMVEDRIADIVDTVCQEGENGFVQLSRIYRYFCDTAHYSREDDDADKKTENRKSLNILFDKDAVCVGISRAFNLCGQYLGYNMQEEFCSSKDPNAPYYKEKYCPNSTHAISKMTTFNRQNGEKHEFYYDLTWDLGSEVSRYFGLSKQQMSVNHQFTIADGRDLNCPFYDIQSLLAADGCLTTSDRNKAVQADLVQRAQNYAEVPSMQ